MITIVQCKCHFILPWIFLHLLSVPILCSSLFISLSIPSLSLLSTFISICYAHLSHAPDGTSVKVSVAVPVTLVSLSGRQEDCVRCMREVYTHLGSVLAKPFSRLLPAASLNCPNLEHTRGRFTVAYNNWGCVQDLHYDTATHRCSESNAVIPTSGANSF